MKKIPKNKLRPWWKEFCKEHDKFYNKVSLIEKCMSDKFGVPDMIFFCSDGDWCGIGTADRKMKLVQFDPE